MDRIVPGLLMAVFWLGILAFGPVMLFSAVVLIIGFIGADEYLRMVTGEKLRQRERVLINVVLTLPILAVALTGSRDYLDITLLFAFFILTGYFLYRYAKFNDSYAFFSRLIFGVVYVGFLCSHLLLLRDMENGAEWLIIASTITVFSDTGAYFVGSAIGKHKLCPNISPKKTVEGALGGLFFAILGAFAIAYLLLPKVNPWFLGVVAVVLTVAAIVGDLTESIIKRGTDTKDSGTWLRGHGGMLDRIDSLLFAVPVLYMILTFFG